MEKGERIKGWNLVHPNSKGQNMKSKTQAKKAEKEWPARVERSQKLHVLEVK